MKKLLSLLVAAVFAVSSGFAVAASHAGGQPMEKKEETKKTEKKSKKDTKKEAKKDKKDTKKDPKKDEMKK